MKEITEEMKQALLAPLPSEAISQHPSKTFLSTIKAIYVTERLNDVFGVGSWQIDTEFVEKVEKMVVCKTTLTIPEYGIKYTSFGGNDNTDLGDAYKGATTDAITKIGSYLGIGIDVFKGKQTHSGKNKRETVIEFYSNNPECEKKLKAMYNVSEAKYLKKEQMDEVYEALKKAGKIA